MLGTFTIKNEEIEKIQTKISITKEDSPYTFPKKSRLLYLHVP